MGLKDTLAVLRTYLVTDPGHTVSGVLKTAVTASGLSLTLNTGHGAQFPEDGTFAVKCGTEIMLVSRSGDVLFVESGGRGICGSAAAIHDAGATVYSANLYDVVGERVGSLAPSDNDLPSIWLSNLDESLSSVDNEMSESVVEIRCFGGIGERPDDTSANVVYRLLFDRLHDKGMTDTKHGALLWAHFESGGMALQDPDVLWTFVLARYSLATN